MGRCAFWSTTNENSGKYIGRHSNTRVNLESTREKIGRKEKVGKNTERRGKYLKKTYIVQTLEKN